MGRVITGDHLAVSELSRQGLTQGQIAVQTGVCRNTVAARLKDIEIAQADSPMWQEVQQLARDLPAIAVKSMVLIALDPTHKDHYDAIKTVLKSKVGGNWLSEKVFHEVAAISEAERQAALDAGLEAFGADTPRGPKVPNGQGGRWRTRPSRTCLMSNFCYNFFAIKN